MALVTAARLSPYIMISMGVVEYSFPQVKQCQPLLYLTHVRLYPPLRSDIWPGAHFAHNDHDPTFISIVLDMLTKSIIAFALLSVCYARSVPSRLAREYFWVLDACCGS